MINATIHSGAEKPPPSPDYPCLKVPASGGTPEYVVFFTNPKTGIVIASNSSAVVGSRSDNWIPDCFKRFQGSIELENAV